MVSTDIGNVCQIANSYLRFERPRSMFGAMMFGNCGYAFPAVIGCKAAAPERSDDWRGLGVAILHGLVMDTLLKATNLPKPTYVHLVDEVVQELKAGDYPLAALVLPPSLDQIQAVSRHLERMPAKSTYFYPKLLTGLVFNPLE